MSKQIGIDLGTTNTVVCYEKNGRPEFLKFGNKSLLPSAIYIEEDNKIIVGQKAISKGNLKPERLIKSSKTHMADNDFVYPDSQWGLSFGLKLTPTNVAEYILKEVKNTLIKRGICEPDEEIETVITVPAYFESNAIKNTLDAGENAGFKVTRIITEPVSAAIAYITDNVSENSQIFVADFGGGTFDITFLKYTESTHNFDTIAPPGGDNHLGGDNIDECVMKMFIEYILDDTGKDFSSQKKSGMTDSEYRRIYSSLYDQARLTKHKLSDYEEYEASIADLFRFDDGRIYHFVLNVNRGEFDRYCEPIYERIEKLIKKQISENNIDVAQTQKILLVGGSCYIPKVKNIIEGIFKGKKAISDDLSNVVALGAYLVSSEPGLVNIVEKIAFDLGIEIVDKNNKSLTVFDTIIPRNTPVPCTKQKTYTTVFNNQKVVDVNVYERGGNISLSDKDLKKCNFYGSLSFDDFKTGKAGEPKINVEFEFDKNRILNVKVLDERTNSSKQKKFTKEKKKIIDKSSAIAQPMDIFLLFDTSGSMDGEGIASVKRAVKQIANEIVDMSIHRVGIIYFANYSNIAVNLTNSPSALIQASQKLQASGATYAKHAFEIAFNELSKTNRRKVVIMLTDGQIHDDSDVIGLSRLMRRANIRIIAIGAGNSDNDALKEIASVRDDGEPDVYPIRNISQLSATFKTIINSLMSF